MNILHKLAVFAALTAPVATSLAQNHWTAGSTTSLAWSDAANWDAGVPSAGAIIYFEDLFFPSAPTNAVKVVNNIVSADIGVGAVNYTATSVGATNHSYSTLIPAGITLTLGGGGAVASLDVGDVMGSSSWLNSGTGTNYSTVTGAGTLNVSDTASAISVALRNRATLDLTGLNALVASVSQVLVGASPDNPNSTGPTGWLMLGPTNNITTTANPSAPGVILASGNGGNSSGVLLLGRTNTINTDGLTVGARRGNSGFAAFGPAFSNAVPASTFTLRGSAGGSSRVSTFSIGDMAAQPSDYLGSPAGSSTGTADFSGGVVDIRADNIYVGRSAADTGAGGGFTYGFGNLIVERGMVDVNRLNIAYKQGTNASSSLNGASSPIPCAVTVKSNAVVTVNQDVTIAFRNNGTNGSQTPFGALIVNDNATVNIGGNITTPTNGWSTLQLGGGTVNMTGNGSITNTTLAGSGTITGANSITVVSNLVPGGVALPGTLNLGGNLVFGTSSPLTFDLGPTNTTGSGVSDYLNVSGNVYFSNNPVQFTFNGPLLAGSNYTLISFTGSRNGALTFVNPTRSQVGLDQSTPGQVNLVVTNWNPGTLTWQGTGANITNVWDASNFFWTNSTGAADRFYTGDAVVFDDTAISTTIYPNGTLYPASITINGSKNFIITNRSQAGPYVGVLAGNCPIVKNGTGFLLLGFQSNNAAAPIYVNNGILRPFDPTFTSPGNNSVLGQTNVAMYVTNAGTFDYYGIGSISSGKPIVIKGTGFNGLGTITNSAVNSGATLNGYFIALAGDATVSADAGGWGIRGLASSGAFYTGSLKLNGYNLTKLGAARLTLQDVIAPDAGNIYFGGGNLWLQNTLLTGAGTLVFSNNTCLQFPFAAGATSYLAKAISTIGTLGVLTPSSGSAVSQVLVDSTISLGGALSVTNNQTLILNNVISGGTAASLTKYGASNLVLNAANTYQGATLITAGTLSLGGSGSLNNSSPINVAPGTTLDVTAKAGSFATTSGQTLNLNGTVAGDVTVGGGSILLGSGAINGSLATQPNSEVALATTNVTGQIIVTNNLTLGGGHLTWEMAPSFAVSDGLVVGGNLTLTGTNIFTVSSIGGFDPSGTNTLITYSGTLTGGLTNLLVTSSARFIVEFVDPALTPGKIQIKLVTPSPVLTWAGGALANPTTWDVKTTFNWTNISGGSNDVFWSSDLVRFDDTSATNVVDLVGTLGPGWISMENSSKSYLFRGNGNIVSSVLTNNAGSLVISNAANNFFTGAGLVLNGGSLTFAQPTNATLTANLAGSGTLNKGGNSNLTLIASSATDFNGAVNINAGTLTAGTSNCLGSGVVSIANGASLDINGKRMTNSSLVNVAGNGADGLGAINNRGIGQTNAALANVTLTGNTTFGALSNAWGISQSLVGAGYAVTKTNANDVWIMTGGDTDLGNLSILQGRLVFASTGTTLGRSGSNIVVSPNATLALAETNAMPQSGFPPPAFDAGSKNLFLQGNAALESIGFPVNQTSTNIFGGAITITNNGIFRVGGNSILVLNGPISGTNGQLILTNGGTLIVNGNNTYSSNTLVYSGTLVLGNSASLPTNTVLYVSNNITSGNPAVQFANSQLFATNNTMRVSSLNAQTSVGGDGIWPGPISLQGSNIFGFYGGQTLLDLAGIISTTNSAGAVVAGGTIAFHGSNTRIKNSLVFGGAVTIGTGDGLGAGFGERFTTVEFDSTNNWTSLNQFDRGRINIGTNNALPPGVAFAAIGTLNAGVADRRTIFDLMGHNQTLPSLREVFPQNGLNLIGNSSATADSVLTYAGTGTATNTWTIQLVDVLDAPATPRKLGLTVTSGTLELLNTNTYTGPTVVSGGTLLIGSYVLNAFTTLTGSLDATTVTVNGTGTFGGNGYVGGAVNLGAGGTLVVGNCYTWQGAAIASRIGTLTLNGGNLTFGAGSRAVFEVDNAAGTNDNVVGIGTATYDGTLIVTNISNVAYTNGQVITLFPSASAYSGAFANIVIPGVAVYDASKLAANGAIIVVTPTATSPIPLSTAVMGGQLQLSWPLDHTGWRLQSQTNNLSVGLKSVWNDVGGSISTNQVTVPIVSTNQTVFYRLVYP